MRPAFATRGFVWSQGNTESAIDDLTEVVRLQPENPVSYFNRASIWMRGGYHARAIADFTEAIRVDPTFAAAYDERGFATMAFHPYLSARKRHDIDSAINDYTEAIRLEPVRARPYTNRGFAFSTIGEFKSAIADFTKAIEFDPKDSDVLNRLARFTQRVLTRCSVTGNEPWNWRRSLAN